MVICRAKLRNYLDKKNPIAGISGFVTRFLDTGSITEKPVGPFYRFYEQKTVKLFGENSISLEPKKPKLL